MLRLLVFVSILSFLAKDIAGISWEIWYQVYKQEIIAEKCENKDKPMMHCDGQCYLSKQLKKLEQKEQEHSSKQNPFHGLNKSNLFCSLSANKIHSIKVFIESKKPFFGYRETFSKAPDFAVFHPPCC